MCVHKLVQGYCCLLDQRSESGPTKLWHKAVNILSQVLGSVVVVDKAVHICHKLMFKEELFVFDTFGVAMGQLNMIASNMWKEPSL